MEYVDYLIAVFPADCIDRDKAKDYDQPLANRSARGAID
jgi:hypothetical protein